MITLAASFALAPQRALEFFRAKGLATSFDWRDMLHEEHDRAFTVAKMADLDLLADVRAVVDRGTAEGWTNKRFLDELKPELVRRGWWGKAVMEDPAAPGEARLVQLGSTRRLRTIFDTNLRTSYAAGHWAAIEKNAALAPYVMYSAVLDARTRPLHRAWNGTILRWDDPWWHTHTPPNGWNCRCAAIQLSERDLERMGRSGPDQAPASPLREWTNPRTGEILQVPAGVDPGWGYAPGLSRRAEDLARLALEKVAAAPADLGAAAFETMVPKLRESIQAEFADWVDKAFAGRAAGHAWQIVGVAAPEDIAWLAKKGQAAASAEIAVEARLIAGPKAQRHAAAGDALSLAAWKAMPAGIEAPQAVLYDAQTRNLLYVYAASEDPRLARIVVQPNMLLKKAKGELNAVRSAAKVSIEDLRAHLKGGQYELVRGEL